MDGNISGRTIFIAGAGPVGLTAALELARRGFIPRIVDREEGPAPLSESRALAINARTLALLEPGDVTPEIVARAQHVEALRIFSHDKRLATVDATGIPGRYDGLHCLPQGDTERILLDRLARFQIAPEWRTEVVRLGADPTAPEVTVRKADGTEETVRCDILVDAEGAHSVIRKALGIGFPGESVPNTFFLADYRYEYPVDTGHAEVHFFNPGAIARIPVRADTLRYVSTLADFAERIDHPAAVAEVPWKASFHVSFRHVDPMSKGNVFLAGDAAHVHSPVGGRGMNLGIEDACWLAWLISEGREQDFSRRRIETARHVLVQTHQLTRMILMRNPVAIAVRNTVLPLVARIPALRRRMVTSVAGFDTPAPPWLQH